MAPRPFAYVDHLRVLDNDASTEDPLELYRTLGFVEEVLLSRQYQFVNLSLGPDLPVEDTDVHAWTSVIDDLLSDGTFRRPHPARLFAEELFVERNRAAQVFDGVLAITVELLW